MANRLKASKLLANDPNDYEARRMLKETDDQATFSIIQIENKQNLVEEIQALAINKGYSTNYLLDKVVEEEWPDGMVSL